MMSGVDFQKVKDEFNQADVNHKVQMYVSAEGLTQDQYKDLLRMFPVSQLHLLEEALQ